MLPKETFIVYTETGNPHSRILSVKRQVNSSNRKYLKDSKTILGAGDGTMGFIIILFLYVIEILQNKSIKTVF